MPPLQPPPSPLVAVCNKGPFLVFFDWDKFDIAPEAASVLDNAVQACCKIGILLVGHTDNSGLPRDNLGLPGWRDTEVQGCLTEHGVSAGVISSQAFSHGAHGRQYPQSARLARGDQLWSEFGLLIEPTA